MSLGAIPFSIPAAFEAQFLAREVVRYGALLKDAETGKIVAHLQQTGIFENVLSQAPSMIGIVSNPVTTLVDAAASVTTVVQNQKIIGQLGNLSAHSKLGCEISPILLESKENERWRIKSLTCVNVAR